MEQLAHDRPQSDLRVAVVTPARDEAAHIDGLVRSADRQSLRPVAWLVVDDGSTDGTDEVVEATAGPDSVVTVVRRPAEQRRSFASKAGAVNFGFRHLCETVGDFDLFACVDADVRLPPDYLAVVARRFDEQPRLGVGGGRYRHEVGGELVVPPTPRDHVPGPAQVFRRSVFEQIGQYGRLPFGGIDSAANVTARMHGWDTRSWPDLVFEHDRRMGTGGGRNPVVAEFLKGRQDRDLGLAPLFALGKLARRLPRDPVVVGSLARLLGYLVELVRRRPPSVGDDVVAFSRAEQRRRMRSLVRRFRGRRA